MPADAVKLTEQITCWHCDGHGTVASYDMDGFLSPDECRVCDGSGHVTRYTETGVLAKWPGGPLLGRDTLSTKESKRG